jgi:sulfur-carrier protein
MLTLRFFASVREQIGCETEEIECPPGVNTVADLRAWLRLRGGVWQDAFAEGIALRAAIQHQMVKADARLPESGEVAFFPPVTGG